MNAVSLDPFGARCITVYMVLALVCRGANQLFTAPVPRRPRRLEGAQPPSAPSVSRGSSRAAVLGLMAVASLALSAGASHPVVEDPDQLHAAWVGDPATSLQVVWRTAAPAASVLEFRAAGSSEWTLVRGSPRPSGTAGQLHEAGLRGLRPGTSYEYRARGSGGAMSRICRARTAPLPGNGPLDVIFVADTGLIGRADGLTEGTAGVIEAVHRLDPMLVLLGGDYAYANTDLRGGSMPTAVDAWFAQMAPVAERAVMMPTYGNHEIKLMEDYLFWAERFPTPEGHDNRRFYSFDAGDAHFVSILAWADNLRRETGTEHGWIGSTAVQWIDQDMAAARARGVRWIIPFLHVAPFSDGANHPSNVDVRAQLGPLFEKHGVKVVLSAHDQSYERTFPLRAVPERNEPTSRALDAYTSSDGVTYLKIGPGGKLSNKNKGFSTWRTEPPPAHTAARNNTAHHFGRLLIDTQRLVVEIHAVHADRPGSVVQDRFAYVLGNR